MTYGLASSIRNEYYVQAAELTGASKLYILFREILPNCSSSILTKIALDVGWVTLVGASLRFCRPRGTPPNPALGTMISEGVERMPDRVDRSIPRTGYYADCSRIQLVRRWNPRHAQSGGGIVIMAETLLDIKDLHVWYKVYGGMLKVLNGVNFRVDAGEKVGLVGETGCGKTTTMKALLRILPSVARVPQGEIIIRGKNVLAMNSRELAELRGRGLSMIFQDPTSALNPVFTIGQQLYDVIRSAKASSGDETMDKRQVALRALREARLPDAERMLDSYPIQLSGGMRQRVCISFAIATARDLLIADEPTTNLDVTIQDQVLRLIRDLVEQRGTSLVLITHSLGLAREMTDRVYVMYAGNMIEV